MYSNPHVRWSLLFAGVVCPFLAGSSCPQTTVSDPSTDDENPGLYMKGEIVQGAVPNSLAFRISYTRGTTDGANPVTPYAWAGPLDVKVTLSKTPEFLSVGTPGKESISVPLYPDQIEDTWVVKCEDDGSADLAFRVVEDDPLPKNPLEFHPGPDFLVRVTCYHLDPLLVIGAITPEGLDARLFLDAPEVGTPAPSVTTVETCRLDWDAMSANGTMVIAGEDCTGDGAYNQGNGGFSISMDGGATWTDIDVPDPDVGPFQRVDHDGTRFVLEASGAFYSFDGADLSPMVSPAGSYHSSFACSDQGVCLSSNWDGGGVLRTNGAGGWDALLGSPPFKFTAIGEGLGRFVAFDGESERVVYTDDDGETWLPGSLPMQGWLSDIEHDGVGRFAATAAEGLVYSDDGITWFESEVTTTGGPVLTMSRLTFLADAGWVANSYNHLLFSDDGAESFVDLPGLAPGHSFFHVGAL